MRASAGRHNQYEPNEHTYFSVYCIIDRVSLGSNALRPFRLRKPKIVFASYRCEQLQGVTKNEGCAHRKVFLQTGIVPTRTCRMAQHNRNSSSSGTPTEDPGQYAIARNRTALSQNRRQGLVSGRRHHLLPQPQEIHRIRRT